MQSAIEFVFGSSLVCNEMSHAKKVTFDPKVRTRKVTLAGDTFDPSGTLTGGSRSTNSSVQWDEMSQKEVERPIAYASRTLTRSQRRYSTTRRELLVVVSFVRHFHHSLLGRKFLIRTNHSSMWWIMSF